MNQHDFEHIMALRQQKIAAGSPDKANTTPATTPAASTPAATPPAAPNTLAPPQTQPSYMDQLLPYLMAAAKSPAAVGAAGAGMGALGAYAGTRKDELEREATFRKRRLRNILMGAFGGGVAGAGGVAAYNYATAPKAASAVQSETAKETERLQKRAALRAALEKYHLLPEQMAERAGKP